MALMPESWLNMPTVKAMMMGLRYWREKSGSGSAERSRWTEATISSSSSWGLVHAGEAKDFERLLQVGLRDQPARAARE